MTEHEAAAEIERLQARNELLEKVVEAANDHLHFGCNGAGIIALCARIAALKEQT